MAGSKEQTEFTMPGRTGIRVTLFLAASGLIYWALQGSASNEPPGSAVIMEPCGSAELAIGFGGIQLNIF